MNIVHLAETNTAYAPARLVHLINKYTEHRAFLLQHKRFIFGNPLGVTTPRCKEEIVAVLKSADVLHFHGNVIFDKKRYMGLDISQFCNKPFLLHYHGTPHRERPHRYRRPVNLLVSTPEMLPLFKTAGYFPNLIDEKLPIYKRRQASGMLQISHHFSLHQQLKDTNVFQQASQVFQENGQCLNFVMIPQMSLEKALTLRADTDIVFDHLQGYYGYISIEGLAQGIMVVNGMSEHTKQSLQEFFGAVPPFFVTSRQNFIADLKRITLEMTAGYAKKGLDFMRKYWSGEKNIKRLIKLYKEL